MTATKRKKNSRQRGNHSHGWGAKKKHRGAGHRGGKGNAGTGKRGDAKKPRIWKDKKYFGKFGFKKLSPSLEIKPVNISYFEVKLQELLNNKLVQKQGDVIVIDVEKLGFNKVLGGGKLTQKYKISAPFISAKAAEKIKAAGGEVVEEPKVDGGQQSSAGTKVEKAKAAENPKEVE